VETNKGLFADERAMLMPQPRSSRIAVDFVLYDGTGVLVAFECKLSRFPPTIRQVAELVGAHALFGREVREFFTVFSASNPAFSAAYRKVVAEYGIDRQHTLTLDLSDQSNGRCRYTVHRRSADGWEETQGEGGIAP
jgi:hypothetical protein